MTRERALLAAGAIVVAGACARDWPAASLGDELGPETSVPQGPLHRPGQPCTWCHGGPSPRAPVWELAGTAYRLPGDLEGLAGVAIAVTDARGRLLTAITNEAGNFWVTVGSGEGEDPGEARIPDPLVFPLRVALSFAGKQREMRNVIGRETSCAACHDDPPGAATVGRVIVEDPG